MAGASWERRTLNEVLEVVSGQVDPRDAPYKDMPHVGGDNIESGTGRLSGIKTAADLGLKSGKYLFDSRDVLYSKIRRFLFWTRRHPPLTPHLRPLSKKLSTI